MRDTTKIRAVAEETIADLEQAQGKPSAEVIAGVVTNLREIVSIAKRMDARTGTSDPSTKKT